VLIELKRSEVILLLVAGGLVIKLIELTWLIKLLSWTGCQLQVNLPSNCFLT